MVIKVDFDLTMTILAHNLYRLFAMELDRYSHFSDISIYEKCIMNDGGIEIQDAEIKIKLKKKKKLPLMLSMTKQFASLLFAAVTGSPFNKDKVIASQGVGKDVRKPTNF